MYLCQKGDFIVRVVCNIIVSGDVRDIDFEKGLFEDGKKSQDKVNCMDVIIVSVLTERIFRGSKNTVFVILSRVFLNDVEDTYSVYLVKVL